MSRKTARALAVCVSKTVLTYELIAPKDLTDEELAALKRDIELEQNRRKKVTP